VRWLPALALAVGCQGSTGEGDEGFLRLVGPVEPGVEATGERTRAFVAWAWVVDGQLGGTVQEVPFEPRVYAYALDVPGPPEPKGSQGRAPDGLRDLPALSWGLPILIEPKHDGPITATVDARALLEWAVGIGPRDDLLMVHPVDGGQVAAFTSDYLLVAMETGTGLSQLGAADAWDPAGAWCPFDRVVSGLTLYDTTSSECGGWRPLASPGERTEFQGVSMTPW